MQQNIKIKLNFLKERLKIEKGIWFQRFKLFLHTYILSLVDYKSRRTNADSELDKLKLKKRVIVRTN